MKNQVMPNTGGAPCVSHCNAPEENAQLKYPRNGVVTSKYTPLTFLPLNLYMQFSRLANIYFLLISFLQVGPWDLTPTSKYATAGPFAVILALNMVREIWEDRARHKADDEVNGRVVNVIRPTGKVDQVQWADLLVGDIVQVMSNNEFPADLVLLASTGDQGMCYLDTCNLDGETNLKIRNSLEFTKGMNSPEKISQLKGRFEYEQPNNRLYTFTGKLVHASGEHAVDNENILLRGSTLRNTEWVIGQIVYTGPQSKIMMNAQKGRQKRSNVEDVVNLLLIGILLFELLVVSIATICMAWWVDTNRDAWYIPYVASHTSGDTALGWFTFLILLNNYVPISLYISLELAKTMQGKLIDWDLEMYHEETDTPALTRTTNLNEELGQIQYIFSDKTGTLTQNVMEFRKCFINGTSYGFGTTEIGEAAAKRGADITIKDPEAVEAERAADPEKAQYHRDPAIHFSDTRLLQRVQEGHPDSEHITDFLRILAVSHTVVPEGDLADPHKIVYQAESPDEGALTLFAKCMGWFFCGKTSTSTTIKALGKEERYEVLNINKFNSSRKRMSSVCRTPEGKIILYVKGADNVMCERLLEGQPMQQQMLTTLSTYATEGLRTLVLAKRELTEEQWSEWNAEHKAATTALEDREGALEAAAELIEKDMIIVGATAIEDKLQVGVPDAIATLAKAGIKIWVLTGDKQETAENIGFACQLLRDDMTINYINGEEESEVRQQLAGCLEKFQEFVGQETEHLALLITGKALLYIMADGRLTADLLTFGRMCKAVIACRVSPNQKRQIVSMVRMGVKPMPMTLSIGDGANDVPMIMEAHVGVGISGNEGMQAVRSADYAIAQFRYLKRLMLVHGRSNYRRVAVMILYSLYKQMLMVTTLFLFNIYNGWSGTVVYESWVLTGFNVFYTFLPIIFYGVLEQDVKAETAMTYPQLYIPGQRKNNFNLTMLAIWMVNGLVHCFIAFWVPTGVFAAVGNEDLGAFGTCMMNILAISANLRLVLEANHISWISHFIVLLSIASFYIWTLILQSAWSIVRNFDGYSGVASYTYEQPIVWVTILLTFVIMNAFDICFFYMHRMYFPNPTYIIQEQDRGLAKRVDSHLVTSEPTPMEMEGNVLLSEATGPK
mmetsp:Transcript_3683/g.9267  ORF Transcript_3683/g.9267 Transcript_3683/m.9267 type:complete len:1125 (-) Transcript_3683:205-3579(-)